METDGSDFQVLHMFNPDSYEGDFPESGLTISGSTLYGTTGRGGFPDSGTVYALNTDGSGFRTLHEFSGDDGDDPWGRLTLSGSILYGTTYDGGENEAGVLYRINTDGSGFSVLHHFEYAQGANPGPGRLAISGTKLYGTTTDGGNEAYGDGESVPGVLFSFDTSGAGFSVVYEFRGAPDDGDCPFGPPVLVGGALYGATTMGGADNAGAIWSYSFKGDLNGDGVIDSKDVRILRNMLGWKRFRRPAPFSALADMDGDGKVTQADLRILMGMI